MEALIKDRRSLPEALFFLSDPMAIGAMSACHEYQIRIPDDIQIIGHDNDEQTAFAVPPLTTVHLPVEEMANACVKQLMGQVNQSLGVYCNKKFTTQIIDRGSC